jgi:Vesicle coat trafficking protein Sec16 mid-region
MMIPRVPHRVNIHGTAPLLVPSGITFSSLREVVEPPGLASSFPGPLFTATKAVKGKVKDVGKWLDDNLAGFEQLQNSNLQMDDIRQIEDKRILYKLVRLLVDHNGVLGGRYVHYDACSR